MHGGIPMGVTGGGGVGGASCLLVGRCCVMRGVGHAQIVFGTGEGQGPEGWSM